MAKKDRIYRVAEIKTLEDEALVTYFDPKGRDMDSKILKLSELAQSKPSIGLDDYFCHRLSGNKIAEGYRKMDSEEINTRLMKAIGNTD